MKPRRKRKRGGIRKGRKGEGREGERKREKREKERRHKTKKKDQKKKGRWGAGTSVLAGEHIVEGDSTGYQHPGAMEEPRIH